MNETKCGCRQIDNSIYHHSITDLLNNDQPINQIKNNQFKSTLFKPVNLMNELNNKITNDHRSNKLILNPIKSKAESSTYRSIKANQFDSFNQRNRTDLSTKYDSVNFNLIQSDQSKNFKILPSNYLNKKFNGKLVIKNLFDCNTDLICPEPYTIIQTRNQEENNQCYCGCKSKNLNCIRVMNGLKRLDNYQIQCIQNAECLEPECLFKTNQLNFNRITGYCPSKEDVLEIY